MEQKQGWPAEWLRGVLELCTLRLLADGPTYGYELASRLTAAGLGQIKGGTLYPLLRRFEQTGRVTVEWRPGDGGPGRKYYVLTADGHRALGELTEQWHDFTQITANVLSAPDVETESVGQGPVGAGATDDHTSTTRRYEIHGA